MLLKCLIIFAVISYYYACIVPIITEFNELVTAILDKNLHIVNCARVLEYTNI